MNWIPSIVFPRGLSWALRGTLFALAVTGCSDEAPPPAPTPPETPTAVTPLPSAGMLKTRVINYSGSSLNLEVDVFAVQADSQHMYLSNGSFSIDSFTGNSGATFTFWQDSVATYSQSYTGPYSVLFMLDQSYSITGTDPNDSRITAGKTFMGALGSGDEVGLAAFADGGQIPYRITYYSSNGSWYTNAVSGFVAQLDALASQEGGNTPLYDAIQSGVNDVSSYGHNANKAMILFSDGADTSSSATLSQAIASAQSLGIKVFTVGLSDSVDTNVLNQIAQDTGGAYSQAFDARQLMSLYGALGRYLTGQGTYYRTQWTVTRNSAWTAGSTFSTYIKISAPGYGLLYVPIYVRVP